MTQMQFNIRYGTREHVEQTQQRQPTVGDGQAVQARVTGATGEPDREAAFRRMERRAEGCGDHRQISKQLDNLGYRARADQGNTECPKGRQFGVFSERETQTGSLITIEIGIYLPEPP
ncbi:Uncharacterised protein [Mycobacteroides abscessus]|nr:Uncharacterised protein [Mycobacteroides abscessus]